MGQKLFEDKIGSLSHSGGTITMSASASTPSYLSLGGQQYKIANNLNMPVGTATANTRYQIFAVVDSGSIILVKSTNENSVGPDTYSSWILVGSFYTGLADTLSAFTNIEGKPNAVYTSYSTNWTAATTNPVIGNGTLTSFWRRDEDTLHASISTRMNTTTTYGSGTYRWSLPPGLTPDTAKMGLYVAGGGDKYWANGSGWYIDNSLAGTATSRTVLVPFWDNTNQVLGVHAQGATNAVSSSTIAWDGSDIITFDVSVPISEWSIAPIKDL